MNLPKHVAIVMDGNGRWAQSRGLPRIVGHEQGAHSIRECLDGCLEAGIKYLTLYAFSSENWGRPSDEVNGLMRLLERFLVERTRELVERNVRLKAIGRLHELPQSCQTLLTRAMMESKNNTALTVILALSYGGRQEIVDAVRSIVSDARAGKLTEDDVDTNLIADRLYTVGIPDPDLFIRTSGEMRISNFLLWQLSYTEFYVTPKLWPEFNKMDLFAAIEEFAQRNRRYGKR